MFQYQVLRDVVKARGDSVVKNFDEKFKELEIEESRKKTIVDNLLIWIERKKEELSR